MLRPYAKLLLATAATLAIQHACWAQFGGGLGGRGAGNHVRVGHVLIEGGGDVSHEVKMLLTAAIPEKLRRQVADKPDAPSSPDWIDLNLGQGKLSEDAEIGLLGVEWEHREISDEEAEKLLDQGWEAARSELERTLRSVQQIARESRRRQVLGEEQELAQQLSDLQSDHEKTLEQLREYQIASSGSRENLLKSLAEMTANQGELQLQRVGVEARRQAIETQIDELRSKAGENAVSDKIVAELQSIVAVRETQLKLAKGLHDAGRTIDLELAHAEAALAEAKIEAMRAAQMADEKRHGGALKELNDELMRLVVQVAETKAQGTGLEEIVSKLKEQLGDSVKTEAEMASLQQRLNAILNRRGEVEEKLREKTREAAMPAGAEVTVRSLDKELPCKQHSPQPRGGF